MTKFTFYVDGLDKYETTTADTYKQAHKMVWDSLVAQDQADYVACLDCVDQEPA